MYLYQSHFDVSFQNVNVLKNLTINGNLFIENSLSIDNVLVNTTANELNYLSNALPGQIVPGKAVIYSNDGELFAKKMSILSTTSSVNDVETLLSLTTKRAVALTKGVGTSISMKVKDNVNYEIEIGVIESVLTDVTPNSETSKLNVKTLKAGNLQTCVEMSHDGLKLLNETAGYYIGDTRVLDKTTLGSTVTKSSLTSVGTLTSLSVSGNVTISGNGSLKVASHDGTSKGLYLGNTRIEATGKELNILKGVVASSADLNLLNGVSPGVITNSKPVIYDANGAIFSKSLIIENDFTSKDNVETMVILQRTTSTTSANNIGVGIEFKSENDNGDIKVIGKIESKLTNVTKDAEVGSFSFKVIDGSILKDAVSIGANSIDLKQPGSTYKINGVDVLTENSLGSSITSSSLTSIGTLST